ncbi:MAG: rhodanese-like domain-containing protein [Candidatus Hodarchaeales archaeon]|jgi:rhodanese-related sulfurtransferase
MKAANDKNRKWTARLLVIYILLFTFSQKSHYDSSIQALILNDYTDISISEAYTTTQNTSSLFILDVRTQEEYSVGHINNSYLLPYTEIVSRQDELPENKSQPILVYCRSGRRSAIASETLIGLNYTTIFNMLDGFSAWLDANYPYEMSNSDPTTDLTTLIILITIICTLGLVIIIIGFLIKSKKYPGD